MASRVTRSQTGKTPKKSALLDDFVETPGAYRRTRKSLAPDGASEAREETEEEVIERIAEEAKGDVFSSGDSPVSNGHTNGIAKRGPGRPRKSEGVVDHKVDTSGHMEFGGSWGVGTMMVMFPVLMWFMWIGAWYFDGGLPSRAVGQSWGGFARMMGGFVYEGAYPSAKAWAIYWIFFVTEGVFYLVMPGVYAKGKALPHLGGRQLDYYCSGVWSFYVSTVLVLGLHYTGLFKLYTLIDEFGPIMSVAIISGFLVSFAAYGSALYRGAEHRMTGYPVYDFFMGAELNPRMFGLLDFKMFFEVRIPWYMLFFLSLGTALQQYEKLGYVSPEVVFILMAHFLYANACAKGEQLIITTWDMYFEKWGFMLIFWNLAGVPLSYCHCTLFLARHNPSEYAWSKPALAVLFTSYLFVYWVWDTCNSQKNIFRARERGSNLDRKAFPTLPYREVHNPVKIETQTGDAILCDGWYGKARKIHYACDAYFAICWGLITGFKSPYPWFYPFFFTCMIIHRAVRDQAKCREKYGEAWLEYERRVPYWFIPYVF